jgi:hypothetical protein
MRKIIAVAFAASLGLCTVSAGAVPIAMPNEASDAMIIKVAQGCGPGMHRGPAGYCRPIYTCPPGWHTGPYGLHCFRNRY